MTSGYVAPSSGLEQVEIDGAYLLFDGQRLSLFAGSAAEIWRALGNASVDEVITLLRHRHPEAQDVEADVRRFVSEVTDGGLAVQQPAAPGNGLVKPDHVAWTQDRDSVVIADLRSGVRVVLTPTAGRIWMLTMAGMRRDDLAGELARRYPDAPARLDREVDSLWDSLIGRGLLERAAP